MNSLWYTFGHSASYACYITQMSPFMAIIHTTDKKFVEIEFYPMRW